MDDINVTHARSVIIRDSCSHRYYKQWGNLIIPGALDAAFVTSALMVFLSRSMSTIKSTALMIIIECSRQNVLLAERGSPPLK